MANAGVPLAILGVYAFVAGVIELFPSVAEAVFGRPVIDPAIEATWGTTLIAVGILALLTARRPRELAVVAWVLVLALVLGSGAYVYYWIAGGYDARTILVPLVLNLVLAAWIGATLAPSARASTIRDRA